MAAESVGAVALDLDLNKKPFTQMLNQAVSDTDKGFNHLQQSTNRLSSGVGSVLGKIGKMFAAAFAISKVVAFGKSCIEVGSDLVEVQNVVDTTFGAMSKDIDDFSKNAIKQFGLSELSAKQYTSTMGAMLKSMGLGTKDVYSMSTALAGLTGDLASFYNLSTDEAFQKIRAGISGETEPLKQLGINMSVANLQAYALKEGITKDYNAMTQAEQAMLRYNYLLSVTSDAQGDFAKTSGSWANQTRILSLQWQSLKANLGQSFIMVFTPIIRGLNAIMAKLVEVTGKFKEFIAMITGQTADTQTVIHDDGGMGSITDGANGATDAVNGTKAAIKDLQRYLLGFDEINKLGEDNGANNDAGITPAGTNAGGGSTSTDTKDLGTDLSLLDKIREKLSEITGLDEYISKISESIKKALHSYIGFGKAIIENLTRGVQDAIDRNKDRIQDWLVKIFDIKAELVDQVMTTVSTAYDILSEVIKSSGAVRITSAIAGAVMNAFMGVTQFVESVKLSIATAITQPFIDAKDKITEALIGLMDIVAPIFEGIEDVVTNTFDSLNAAYEEYLAPAFTYIQDGISQVLNAILDFWNNNLQPVLEECGTQIKDLLDNYVQPVIDVIIQIIGALIEQISVIWDNYLAPFVAWIVDTFGPYITDIIKFVKDTVFGAIQFILSELNSLLQMLLGIIKFFTDIFKGDWESAWKDIENVGANAWAFIKGIFSGVPQFFSNVFNSAYNCISNIFGRLGGFFSGIWSSIKAKFTSFGSTIGQAMGGAFKGALNGALSTVERVLNSPIRAINGLLDVINKVPGINLSHIGTLNLPRLAQGGYLKANQPQLAVVGDNKTQGEIVAPEDKIKQCVGEALAEYIGQMSGVSQPQQQAGDTEIVVNIGEDTIIRKVIKGINDYNRTHGKSQIVLNT